MLPHGQVLLYIGLLWKLYKNYAAELVNKYKYGTICLEDERKLITASWYIEEVELYYQDCSCLEDEDICEMIEATQLLLK